MRSKSIVVTILLLPWFLNAQIGGVAGTKINAINHKAIETGKAEFEPNYGITWTKSTWDDEGNTLDFFGSPDSILVEGSMSLRMAYALDDRWEVGAFIANEFSNWSFKYALLTEEKLGVGLQAGLNMPYGIQTIDKNNKSADQLSTYIMGVSGTYEFSESFSVDANLQWQNYFDKAAEAPNSDVFMYVDAGKYLGDSKVLLMASISYQYSNFDILDQNKFTFYPGIAFEMKDNFFIVLNGAFDLTGKNIEKTSGFAAAWTITL